MPQVSYSGSDSNPVLLDQIGNGQGLQVGDTLVDFSNGLVQFQGVGNGKRIGTFRGLSTKNADKLSVKSLIFRAKTKCLITIDDSVFNYETIGEYITFNHIDITTMKINRSATGQGSDVFDWQFIASSDPEYRFTIQKANRDGESEIVFPNLSRVAGTYVQNVNLRGSKKITVIGNSPASAETGVSDISIEVFDSASQAWIPIASKFDVFTLTQGVFTQKAIGENTNRKLSSSKDFEYLIYQTTGGAIAIEDGSVSPPPPSSAISIVNTMRGIQLPSGDAILRIKAVVTVNPLTFSISVIKVFD